MPWFGPFGGFRSSRNKYDVRRAREGPPGFRGYFASKIEGRKRKRGGSTGSTERPHRGPKEGITKATKIE